MKYLRKFNTEAEYEAAERSPLESYVSLVGTVVKYDKGTPAGVYIQHINGKLYTTADWSAAGYAKEDANGVAFVDARASFVVAKEDAIYKSGPDVGAQWSTEAVFIEGVSSAEASYGTWEGCFNGQQDTQILVESGLSPAADACAAYTFPNGVKGYLPSVGEWQVYVDNEAAAQEALILIGGKNYLISPNSACKYWSSTQKSTKSPSSAWEYSSRQGIQSSHKTTVSANNGYVRAFGAL